MTDWVSLEQYAIADLKYLVFKELYINSKRSVIYLLSIIGAVIPINYTSALRIWFADFNRIATGLNHSQNFIQPYDEESITVDENEFQISDATPTIRYCNISYLNELRQIDAKRNWPINSSPHQESARNQKPLEIIEPQDIPRLKPAPIKTYFVKHPDVKFPIQGYVEGGALYANLTSNYGIWSNQYLRGLVRIDNKNNLGFLATHNYEFREHGDYAVIDETHMFNDEWTTRLSMGISNKSFFVPKYYIGGTVFKKPQENKAWIPYFGIHAYWWRPVYATQSINPGVIYYFQKPWIVELGAYINRSAPGNIYSASVYAVATEGREKEHYITLRVGIGKEAYLPLGAGVPAAVGYFSAVVTATWRQWWGRDWGTNIVGENYNNPFYKRYGASVGIFKDFSI